MVPGSEGANIDGAGTEMCSGDEMNVHEQDNDEDGSDKFGDIGLDTQSWRSWDVGKQAMEVTLEELRACRIDVSCLQ